MVLSLVEDKEAVEVVTMGTDWEAGSEASEAVLSVNTLTAKEETGNVTLAYC